MQLKKFNWKRLRQECPCRRCGQRHETKQCVRRNGCKISRDYTV